MVGSQTRSSTPSASPIRSSGVLPSHNLTSEALRREIHEGLEVVDNWNNTNDFIFYGKGGEIATNRSEDQELAALSLHLLQACLVFVNVLMLQAVLAEPPWAERMTPR